MITGGPIIVNEGRKNEGNTGAELHQGQEEDAQK